MQKRCRESAEKVQSLKAVQKSAEKVQRKETAKELALEQKVKELEKALEYERLRTLALDTMIDVAEDKLNVSIRKKSGARQ